MEYRQVDFLSIIIREAQDLVSSLKTAISKYQPASGERERNSYYASHGRNYEIGGTICKRRKNRIFYGRGHDGENRTNHDPVTKIRLKYYIDETADGIVYRPVWSFCCPYQWKDSPEEQELFYIDGETGALIRDALDGRHEKQILWGT
mgnify:CR=1 FL=1